MQVCPRPGGGTLDRRNPLTVTDDRRPIVTAPAADPAPLGLAAFALTTFLLSGFNAGWMTAAGGLAWLGYAFGYGGFVQLLAGMWEFRNRNVFGATAFSSYGGFWLGLGIYFLIPGGGLALITSGHVSQFQKDAGWILLAFAIFNTYMLLWSTMVNGAVFGVFLTLEATEIILFIGNFAGSSGTVKTGGYVGVLTALVAWYASAAGVVNGMRGAPLLPVGKPFGMGARRTA
jgi:succinate-acetate transporter protein